MRKGDELVAPDDKVSVGWDDGSGLAVALGNLILSRFLRIITQVHALYVDGLVGGVVEFHPVVAFEVIVDVDAVCGAHLIDAHGGDSLFLLLVLGKWGKGGDETECVVTWKVDGGICGKDSVAFLPARKAITARSLCLQPDRSKERSVEVGVGHIDAVDADAGPFCVGF